MLYLVKGRAGSGKTNKIRQIIGEYCENNESKPLLIVPEQFSFESERAMLKFLGAKKLKQIDVLSFPRMALSNIKPNLFKGMGTTLGVVLLISLVVEIFCLLVGISTGFFDFLFVIVFSLYIGYDWYKAQQLDRTKDNAIDVALEIYLDIINLFLRLLSLFGKRD